MRRSGTTPVNTALVVAAAFYVAIGVWAFAAPRSFYDVVATYPPYHAHLLRDIGAFMLGIGAAQLGALVLRDVRLVALLGAVVASGLHWVSHVVDRHHGGSPADPWLTGVLALLLLVGLVARITAVSTATATGMPTSTGGADR